MQDADRLGKTELQVLPLYLSEKDQGIEESASAKRNYEMPKKIMKKTVMVCG